MPATTCNCFPFLPGLRSAVIPSNPATHGGGLFSLAHPLNPADAVGCDKNRNVLDKLPTADPVSAGKAKSGLGNHPARQGTIHPDGPFHAANENKESLVGAGGERFKVWSHRGFFRNQNQ